VARLKAAYGIDRPLVERYLHWGEPLAGEFGYSRLSASRLFKRWTSARHSLLLMDELRACFCRRLVLGIARRADRIPARRHQSVLFRRVSLPTSGWP